MRLRADSEKLVGSQPVYISAVARNGELQKSRQHHGNCLL